MKYLSLLTLMLLSACSNIETESTTTIVPSDYTSFSNVDKNTAAATPKAVKNLSLGEKQVVWIRDEIGSNADEIATQIKRLYSSKKPIYVLIDSPGGSVIDGAQIVTAIQASPVPVYTVCLKICASMAAIIHGYGSQRFMVDRSILMHHPASGGVQGSLEQMMSRLSTIQRYTDKMTMSIAKRAGLSVAEFKSLTVNEMWLDAEDAVARKFAEGIVTVDVPEAKFIQILAPTSTEEKQVEKTYEFIWK